MVKERVQIEGTSGFPAEPLEAMVEWIRTLKAEGVTPDVAASLFVQVMQATMEASPFMTFDEDEEY